MRLTSYAPGQMVIILGEGDGEIYGNQQNKKGEKISASFFVFGTDLFVPGCGTNFCFMCKYYITLWLTYLRPIM